MSSGQHELITAILCAAGGEPVELLLPPDYKGKRADVVFRSDGLIAEVKSLTSDRRRDPAVSVKLGETFVREAANGGPVVFGTININLHDLPVPLAERALRIIGDRVRTEVNSAASQLAATRGALAMADAYGLVVFVSPPDRIGHRSMAWLIADEIRQRGNAKGLDGAMVIETPLAWAQAIETTGDSYSALWSISGKPFPAGLAARIGAAWEAVTAQPARPLDVEEFPESGTGP